MNKDYIAKPNIPNPDFKDKLIKVCLDPCCEAIYHNCEHENKRCLDCGHKLLRIDFDTWQKKYTRWFFQYNFKTHEFYRPQFEDTMDMFAEPDCINNKFNKGN